MWPRAVPGVREARSDAAAKAVATIRVLVAAAFAAASARPIRVPRAQPGATFVERAFARPNHRARRGAPEETNWCITAVRYADSMTDRPFPPAEAGGYFLKPATRA